MRGGEERIQHNYSRACNFGVRNGQCFGVDGDEAERDGDCHKPCAHTPDSGDEEATATDWVDEHHINPGLASC